MKKIFSLLVMMFGLLGVNSQNNQFEGSWEGELEGIGMEVIIHITDEGGELKATMDSPKQSAYGIKIEECSSRGDSLFFSHKAFGMSYAGKLLEDEIDGLFSQNGSDLNLLLEKTTEVKTVKKEVNRPQTPNKPYSYFTEDISFYNANDSIELKGTLSLPSKEGSYPIIVMISGSGPQNRDSEVFGHKLFLVVSDYLVKRGIGTLRFDDRGVGESEGSQKGATSLDFSNDAEAAVVFLKSKNYCSKIGLYGHSEGGLIAPMVASRNENVNFLVLVAAPGVRGDLLLEKQVELSSLAEGIPKEVLATNQKAFGILTKSILKGEEVGSKENREKLNRLLEGSFDDESQKEQVINGVIKSHSSKWYQEFVKTDPADYLNKLKVPTMALNGDKDLQVYYKQNLEGIKKNISSKYLTTYVLKNHNHLMQHSETGKVSEYGEIEETASEEFLKLVGEEILKLTSNK